MFRHLLQKRCGLLALALGPVKYFQEAVRNYAAQIVANDGGRFRLPKKHIFHIRWVMI